MFKYIRYSAELLQWECGSSGYIMFPGSGKIKSVTLRILNENCSTLASDKRPSLLFSYKNVYFEYK